MSFTRKRVTVCWCSLKNLLHFLDRLTDCWIVSWPAGGRLACLHLLLDFFGLTLTLLYSLGWCLCKWLNSYLYFAVTQLKQSLHMGASLIFGCPLESGTNPKYLHTSKVVFFFCISCWENPSKGPLTVTIQTLLHWVQLLKDHPLFCEETHQILSLNSILENLKQCSMFVIKQQFDHYIGILLSSSFERTKTSSVKSLSDVGCVWRKNKQNDSVSCSQLYCLRTVMCGMSIWKYQEQTNLRSI